MAWGWAMVDTQSVGSLAAFVVEPILSAGGIFEPPPGYMKKLAAECKKRGMLLIADGAQTGLGRTGDLFAFHRDGIVPDILALLKTIGCGLSVASVSTTPEIEKLATAAGYLWVTTHCNDPLPAAVASKVIEIVVRDDLSAWAKARGEQLLAGMRKLQEKYLSHWRHSRPWTVAGHGNHYRLHTQNTRCRAQCCPVRGRHGHGPVVPGCCSPRRLRCFSIGTAHQRYRSRGRAGPGHLGPRLCTSVFRGALQHPTVDSHS